LLQLIQTLFDLSGFIRPIEAPQQRGIVTQSILQQSRTATTSGTSRLNRLFEIFFKAWRAL
jgi:hypothetical protein